VIDRYKNAVIILMVSYVSNDTVSKPLAAGAKDYILKPFMIEELIRKIQHFQQYERIRRQNVTYERYLAYSFESVTLEEDFSKTELPVMIYSNYQKYADAFAFGYANYYKKTLQFVSLTASHVLHDIDLTTTSNTVFYITDFQTLKKSEHKAFFELIEKASVIIATTEPIETIPFRLISIESETQLFDQGEILPIEEYVKYIMTHFQNRFPDTELSKKLGISRKSLWEKRKKYGIIKKK
jgi:DNA-binding response OmpR family regulator